MEDKEEIKYSGSQSRRGSSLPRDERSQRRINEFMKVDTSEIVQKKKLYDPSRHKKLRRERAKNHRREAMRATKIKSVLEVLEDIDSEDFSIKANILECWKDLKSWLIIDNITSVAYGENGISQAQRGFRPGVGTGANIKDILDFGEGLKRMNKRGALVFIDFRKAYDSVNRSILLRKLAKLGIHKKVINLLHNIFKKSKLWVKNKCLKVDTGVMQGSTLSPVLFNIYIDDLIRRIQSRGYFIRAYADDVVVGTETYDGIDEVTEIIERWCESNCVNLNTQKSGILRILKRASRKVGNLTTKIPEVTHYKYLGVNLSQSLKLDGHVTKLRVKERMATEYIKKISNSPLSLSTRLLILKTIACPALLYGLPILGNYSRKYYESVEGSIYRLCKLTLKIPGNPPKKKVMELLGIDMTRVLDIGGLGDGHWNNLHPGSNLALVNFSLKARNWKTQLRRCTCGEENSKMIHLLERCTTLSDWRMKIMGLLGTSSPNEIVPQVTDILTNARDFDKDQMSKLKELIGEFNRISRCE